MTEHTRLDKLIVKPPKPKLTQRKFVQRLAGQVLAIAGIIVGSIGIEHAVSVGRCLNANLGQRSAPSASDASAHIAWAKSLDALLTAPPGGQRADVTTFITATGTYVHMLEADQADRNAHPLGKC